MELCGACGESCSASHVKDVSVDQLIGIYFKLVGVQLTDVMEPHQLVFCGDCSVDLKRFDKFRKKCLEVYQRLKDVKVEAWQEDTSMLVEVKMESDEEPLAKKQPIRDSIKDEPSKGSVQADLRDTLETKDDEDEDDDEDEVDNDDNDFNIDDNEESESEIEEPKLKTKKKNTDRSARIKNREKSTKKREKKPFLTCPKCPAKFRAPLRHEAHLRMHEGLKPYLCKVCDKSFDTYRNCRTHHRQKHTDDKLTVPCKFEGCTVVCSSRQAAKRHFQRCHDPNFQAPEQTSFMCDICGNSFTQNAALKRHKYTHEPEKMPYSCPFCPKKYHVKSRLDYHIKRHQGQLDCECPLCGIRKASQYDVNQHIKKVHEKLPNEPVPCEICQTMFSSKMGLKRHIDVVHRKIKKYSCSVCGFMFSQKDHLNRHMKSHKRLGEVVG